MATAVVAVARENGVSLTAAGLAFYTFNSLVPLLLFVVIGATAFGRLESSVVLFERVADVDADAVLSTTDAVVGGGTGRRRAALIAAAILGWSALTMVQSVNTAFGSVYGIREERTLSGTVADSLLVLGTVVLAVIPSIAGLALAVATDALAARLASVPLLFVALLGAFVPMYYRFPAEGVTLGEAVPGAAATAVTWTACAVGFRLYVVTAESVRLYGVAGGVMLLLTWLYVGSLALVLGAVLNAVLAGRVDADERWKVSV